MLQKKIIEQLKLSYGILIGIALAIGLSVLAFTEPALAPPGCTPGTAGCDAPLNVGTVGQSKNGWLRTTKFFVGNPPTVSEQGAGDGLLRTTMGAILNEGGAATGLVVSSGNVGIGVPLPSYKLDIVSGGATTARFGTAATDQVTIGGGAGKLNVGTVDPLYTINGNVYATYLPGMVGVKAEITGTLHLQWDSGNHFYQTLIRFNELKEGSDLWLFSRIIDFNLEAMSVLLTPSAPGRAWYVKNNTQRTLSIMSDTASEVSYRLTAPRFDHAQWPTQESDDTPRGFIVP
ncbi:MAG: hypothetical protein AAB604_02515 [Patescibacteria group bacterium]